MRYRPNPRCVITTVDAVAPTPPKERKDNSGWENIRKWNRERAAAKKILARKKASYRAMVGSGREFERRKKELREMGYL